MPCRHVYYYDYGFIHEQFIDLMSHNFANWQTALITVWENVLAEKNVLPICRLRQLKVNMNLHCADFF